MSQTNFNAQTIGQKLEAARQAKGVTVSEAGEATKILSKFITAMETDDFGVLSAPVYAKSFIRMYANYLGLDFAPLVEEYTRQHTPSNAPKLKDGVQRTLAKTGVQTAGRPHISGRLNAAIAKFFSGAASVRTVVALAAALLLAAVMSVTQCAEDNPEVAVPEGAASIRFERIAEPVPDAYLAEPGQIDLVRGVQVAR